MTSKILVADDSITIQKIVAMAFENEDAVVEGIGNGKAAFERLKNFSPDVVLADVDMPGYNGFELSRRIKESSEFQSVSVLLLASDFEDFNEGLFLESRADDHISKPFKSDDIVQKVKELLQHPPATLRDGDWAGGNAAWDDDDEEEQILALSEKDMIAEPAAKDSRKAQEDTIARTQADIEKAFAEPGWDDAPKTEPVQTWEPPDEAAWKDLESEPAPWHIADAESETNAPPAADTPEASEDPPQEAGPDKPLEAAAETESNETPVKDFSFSGDAAGDPLVALSTDEEDLDFELPPRADAGEELKPHVSADREDSTGTDADDDTGNTETTQDESESTNESELPGRPVSPESRAIDEAIDAVNALKKYSASMQDDSDTGLGIGFQSVEIKGEPESYEDKDYDPTLDLELPSEESEAESHPFDDSDFGIGLGLPPEQQAALPKSWEDDEDVLSGIGDEAEPDSGELDVVFHPLTDSFRRPRSWDSDADDTVDESDWDYEEAIAPEPEDLLSNLVIHPLPSTAETARQEKAVDNPPPVFRPPAPESAEDTETNARNTADSPSQPEAPVSGPETEPALEAVQPEPVKPDSNKEKTPTGEETNAMDDSRLKAALNEEVRTILQHTISASVEKELSGLSAAIVRSVREIVREITPGIAEAVIKAEIDRIKKMEDA